MTDQLRIVFEPEGGWWSVHSPDEPALATQGKTLATARKRAREALSSLWDDWPRAKRAELVEEFALPEDVLQGLEALESKRRLVLELQQSASAQSRKLARALVKYEVSLRDAGALLSLSHQRVAQLVAD